MRILLYTFLAIFLISGCDHPDRSGKNGAHTERTYSGRNPDLTTNTRNKPESDPIEEKKNTVPKSKNTTEAPKNLSDLFQKLQREVFMIYTINGYEEVSQGSGFFIAPGIGITNYHVLEDSEDAVIYINGEAYEIIDIKASSQSDKGDYIIFKTTYRTKTPLKIARKKPRIGEDIFAIGSPKGLSNSLTKGTVSGFRENDRIQIDATIDHGSSGGPLFNLEGEVIGITTSGMGTGSELNFAVNIQALPYKEFVHN